MRNVTDRTDARRDRATTRQNTVQTNPEKRGNTSDTGDVPRRGAVEARKIEEEAGCKVFMDSAVKMDSSLSPMTVPSDDDREGEGDDEVAGLQCMLAQELMALDRDVDTSDEDCS
jgi:hypothetical protein